MKEKILNTKLMSDMIALFYLGQVGFIIKYKEKYIKVKLLNLDFFMPKRQGEFKMAKQDSLNIIVQGTEEKDKTDYVGQETCV